MTLIKRSYLLLISMSFIVVVFFTACHTGGSTTNQRAELVLPQGDYPSSRLGYSLGHQITVHNGDVNFIVQRKIEEDRDGFTFKFGGLYTVIVKDKKIRLGVGEDGVIESITWTEPVDAEAFEALLHKTMSSNPKFKHIGDYNALLAKEHKRIFREITADRTLTDEQRKVASVSASERASDVMDEYLWCSSNMLNLPLRSGKRFRIEFNYLCEQCEFTVENMRLVNGRIDKMTALMKNDRARFNRLRATLIGPSFLKKN